MIAGVVDRANHQRDLLAHGLGVGALIAVLAVAGCGGGDER